MRKGRSWFLEGRSKSRKGLRGYGEKIMKENGESESVGGDCVMKRMDKIYVKKNEGQVTKRGKRGGNLI